MAAPHPEPIAAPARLVSLPAELLALAVSRLPSPEDIARVDCVGRVFHAPPPLQQPPSPPPQSVVEIALCLRASERGRPPPAGPAPAGGWTQWLLWEERLQRANPPQPVAAGVWHSAFVNAAGALLTCGREDEDDEEAAGLLGHGEGVTRLAVPTAVPSLQVRIRSVSAGEYHTLAVSDAGAAFSFGGNESGQLGHGVEGEAVRAPRQIEALRSVVVVAVSAGGDHSLALATNGVYSFGRGDPGQLGHGDTADQPTPKLIEAVQTRVLSISAGGVHSLLLDERGTVLSCGWGTGGQLGHGDSANVLVPTPIPGLVARAISAGNAHSLAVTPAGALFAFGLNNFSQLGLGDTELRCRPTQVTGLPAVRAVSAGLFHSLALTRNGGVYSCGHSARGQLGLGEVAGAAREPTEIEALRGVGACVVAAGAEHSLAATSDGRAFGWGDGGDETLGLGLTENQPLPMEYSQLKVRI